MDYKLISTRVVCHAVIIILMAGSLPSNTYAQSPETLAKELFYEIEADPFNRSIKEKAAQTLFGAFDSEPENPWVLVAMSRFILEMGYKKGDRSKMSAYIDGVVDKAGEFAEQAIKYGAEISMVHIQHSKIQMIKGDLKGAWITLNEAYKLDPEGFYPWYYKGVIAILMKDLKRAESYLIEAEERINKEYQKSWIAGRRINVAKLIGNDSGIEEAYLKSIELEPASPHKYGNYANYLKKKKRYSDALSYYEKAIDIYPYPQAKQGLAEVKAILTGHE